MNGFQNIFKLPYCVNGVDGNHIPWKCSPITQYHDCRRSKGFLSFVLLEVADSRRKFQHTEAKYSGVMGDSTIFSVTKLKGMIDKCECLDEVKSYLKIAQVNVHRYSIRDFTFSLNGNMMKTSTDLPQRNYPDLKFFE